MLVRCPHCDAIIHLEDSADSQEIVTCWMCTSVIVRSPNAANSGPATLNSQRPGLRDRPAPIGLSQPIFLEASNHALGPGERIKIQVVEGPSQGVEFEVSKSITTIGRVGGGADLEIDDPEVSRAHCAVEVRRDGVLLHDLRSTNGTYLRDSRVSVARLESASKFQIGGSKLLLRTT
jgi:Inner membrane component of T3SS, cytoplasmic domain